MGICKLDLMRREAEKQGRFIFPEPCSQLRGSSAFQRMGFISGMCFPLLEHALCFQTSVCLFLGHTHHALIPAMMHRALHSRKSRRLGIQRWIK